MNRHQTFQRSSAKIWLLASCANLILGWLTTFLVGDLVGNADNSVKTTHSISYVGMVFFIIALIFLMTATAKLRRWLKLVPIILIFVCIGGMILLYFIGSLRVE